MQRTERFMAPQKEDSVPELRSLMSGLVFGEQPRWHEDRLWFSDWGTREVIAVDLEGKSEVILRGPSFPLCVDWLPDGRRRPRRHLPRRRGRRLVWGRPEQASRSRGW